MSLTHQQCTLCGKRKPWKSFVRSSDARLLTACSVCRRRTAELQERVATSAARIRDPQRVPAYPLQTMLRERLEHENAVELSRRLDGKFSADQVRLLARDGARRTMNLDQADRWCIALGTHLDLVYEDAV